MFSFIKKMIEDHRAVTYRKAEGEIYPDLYIQRGKQIRNERIKEVLGLIGFGCMVIFYFGLWLAYEGWITPETIRSIF